MGSCNGNIVKNPETHGLIRLREVTGGTAQCKGVFSFQGTLHRTNSRSGSKGGHQKCLFSKVRVQINVPFTTRREELPDHPDIMGFMDLSKISHGCQIWS